MYRMQTTMDPIVLTILLLFSGLSSAERRQLYCEVPDENSNGGISGRQGKSGPKGEKGEPGVQGVIGEVDSDSVTNILDSKIQEIGLASSLEEFFALSLRHNKLLEIIRNEELCKIRYSGLCYWVTIHHVQDLSFSHGTEICAKIGGEVAIVTGQAQYDKIASLIRTKIPYDLTKAYVWTAMTLNPATGVVRFPNNQVANFVKWWPGHPNSLPGETQMVLDIQKQANEHLQGMWATRINSKIHGVLCQFNHS